MHAQYRRGVCDLFRHHGPAAADRRKIQEDALAGVGKRGGDHEGEISDIETKRRQIDPVDPVLEIHDVVAPRIEAEDENVGATAARENVIVAPAVQPQVVPHVTPDAARVWYATAGLARALDDLPVHDEATLLEAAAHAYEANELTVVLLRDGAIEERRYVRVTR